MAFDLKAVLRLKDEFSGPMRRAQRAAEQMNSAMSRTQRTTGLLSSVTGRLRNSLGQISAEVKRANLNLTHFGNGLRNIANETSGIRRLTVSFTGLAAAIGGAVGAQKLFNATVGEAAKYERSQGLITAMMGDANKAKKFMEEINKMAINSPLLNSQDMMAAASAFLPITKDINRLKKLYDLSERLYVLNDKEGMEGASYALREFLLGKDAQSLSDRFNLNRKVLNELKNLSFDKAVAGLDKLLNKMGITRQTINQIGNDTLAKWNQIKERIQVMLRQMGEPSLKVLNNFMTNLINRFDSGDLTRFANVGARIIQSILTGLTNGVTRIYNWFSTITNSPEFQQRTTITGKVKFIIEDLYQRFLNWLNSSGSKQIQSLTTTLINTLASAIQNNAGPLAKAAITVGWKIGSSVAQGIMNALANNPIARMVAGGAGTVAGIAKHYYNKMRGLFGGGKSKSHAGGLNYVPYDRYPALLHRGEMVLPRGEAEEYRKGRASGVSVTISGNTFHVRQESDIQKIAYELAKLLEREGALMAQ